MTEYFKLIVRFSHVFFISTCCDAKYQSAQPCEPEEVQGKFDHVSEGGTVASLSEQESEQVGEFEQLPSELHG